MLCPSLEKQCLSSVSLMQVRIPIGICRALRITTFPQPFGYKLFWPSNFKLSQLGSLGGDQQNMSGHPRLQNG